MLSRSFVDFVRALVLVAAAAYASVIAPDPAPVDVAATASMEDATAAVRAAEDAERRACAAYTVDPRDICAAR